MARQPPLRIIGTIRTCLRRNNFSTSLYAYDDNNNNKQSPPQSSSPPPPPLQPSQLASSSIRSPAYSSIGQTRNEGILKLIDDIFRDAMGGSPQSRSRKDSHGFQPASTSTMPLPANATQTPIPLPSRRISGQRPGYIHIHAVSMTKNIHVTVTDYKHDPIITMSAGRLGIKHSKRQTHEAGYDTTLATFEKLANSNLEIQEVEIVLKGFGKGRQGFMSAMAGQHGEFLRNKVVRVTDATPLRIGGERLPNKKRR